MNPGFNRWAHVPCVRAVLGLPGPGGGGDGENGDPGFEDGEVGLRPGTDDEEDRREAVTLHKRYPNAIYLPDTPDHQELREVSRPKRSHQRWEESDDEVLRASVAAEHSAFALSITMERSRSAILARIRKLYGDDSNEVKRYGTWDRPGELAGHQPNDWYKLRVTPCGRRSGWGLGFDPYDGEYCLCGALH